MKSDSALVEKKSTRQDLHTEIIFIFPNLDSRLVQKDQKILSGRKPTLNFQYTGRTKSNFAFTQIKKEEK